MAFAITEPDAGSELAPHLDDGAARRRRLACCNGTKYYISGVDEAGAVLVVARTGTDEASGRARLLALHRRRRLAGPRRSHIPIEIAAPEKQFTLFFDDVRGRAPTASSATRARGSARSSPGSTRSGS